MEKAHCHDPTERSNRFAKGAANMAKIGMKPAIPLISVVTAFYNRESEVASSIGSLLAQSYPNLEIVVVDDGSTDGTAAALRKLNDPRITIISRPNRGFVASMNEAIAASRGEFVAVHGSGDLSLPDRISHQAEVLRERLEVGVVGCWVENDEADGNGTRIYKAPAGLPFHQTLLTRNLFTHGEAMFRRSLYDQVGGYREFFHFAQDRDLWLRISRLADYAIVPEVLYRRFKPSGGISTDPDRMVLQTYLSDFAVQCAKTVDEGERDPVDKYGHLAVFLRERPATLARKLAWYGAKIMVAGDIARGWAIICRARQEQATRQVAVIYALAATHRYPLLWRQVGRPLLARRLISFRN
jgi:glycosyltransferase involved in cell wall biosynthesis